MSLKRLGVQTILVLSLERLGVQIILVCKIDQLSLVQKRELMSVKIDL